LGQDLLPEQRQHLTDIIFQSAEEVASEVGRFRHSIRTLSELQQLTLIPANINPGQSERERTLRLPRIPSA